MTCSCRSSSLPLRRLPSAPRPGLFRFVLPRFPFNFDVDGPLSYTELVHRVLALLLIPALTATSGVASLLHTHAYTDHDHPEHHHGPALHEHHHSEVAHHDRAEVTLESCDPGQHAVSVSLGSLSLPNLHMMDSESGHTFASRLLLSVCSIKDRCDVRVHGPPSHSQIPSRAPPLPLHA
jgi:hypothetical protein